jgi:hypothetical protein
MGRYYTGQISGKFWFGIQDSTDADFFGTEYSDVFSFYVCGCEYFAGESKEYCDGCFGSLEEHMAALEADDIQSVHLWHLSDCEIRYEFSEFHSEKVAQKIGELEGIVGQYMSSYVLSDNDEGTNIEYSYTVPADVVPNDLPLIAKLCLGKQILYCLEKYGTCSFVAEL